MTCRFIEEYANHTIKLLEKEKENLGVYGLHKETVEAATNGICETVRKCRKGLITVDECMNEISTARQRAYMLEVINYPNY